MIVLINGSFGAGKSTVAKLLRRSLPGSVIYDPEWAGVGLMHCERLIKFKGSGTDDFQNINLWRRTAIWGVRLLRLLKSGPVIVPMTFTRREYLEEIIVGLQRVEPSVKVFCLQASLPTLEQRLIARGVAPSGQTAHWIARRNLECVQVHGDPYFGQPLKLKTDSANEVAAEIFRRMHSN